MIENVTRLKELRKYCRSTIVKPHYLDERTWAYAFHLLKTYYAYGITREKFDQLKADVVCVDLSYIWEEIRQSLEPEEYLLLAHLVDITMEDWLKAALELEEYEVSQNLKNIFDFCVE